VYRIRPTSGSFDFFTESEGSQQATLSALNVSSCSSSVRCCMDAICAAWMAGSMNLHICVGRATQNTVCHPLTRYRFCLQLCQRRGIQWLTSCLLCNHTQQIIQRICEKKHGNRFKERPSCVLVCVAMQIVPGGKNFTKMWRCRLDLHLVVS
jgi:hypothetical protein